MDDILHLLANRAFTNLAVAELPTFIWGGGGSGPRFSNKITSWMDFQRVKRLSIIRRKPEFSDENADWRRGDEHSMLPTISVNAQPTT